MIDAETLAAAERVLALSRAHKLRIGTAESCTGGLIAGALTAIAGSSDVVEGGFVTYSNEAKTAMIGVTAELFATVGAVSDAVASAMADGVLDRLPRVDLAVSVTGIAGPGGGSAGKPVGLVHFGVARRGRPTLTAHKIFPGDRAEIRQATVSEALALLVTAITS
ncbi:MAG TPA: nicotinamide-nucleotide amidohydrolase family protein [Aliidongia sp.]|uniref:CinA family protein n=1 Tax=Aliidongia sp. TaxID=1914230 RepID=UPI002DDD8292|nr:nicotinamide-nucleotide amidohydrolase family protein [Aliidongia sp.]HEV2678541.1 nicotinamide-nucleotide amidohydrolase family protein [Aliidongia sp.]